jgi:UDP-N-acetylenolpyruvoylglucosamine reductase
MNVADGVSLSRLTTVGTGGPAKAYLEVAAPMAVREALAWAADRGLSVVPIGLGSNVLAADEGVDALVLRLVGALAGVSVRGETLVAGGGATNAVCLHRARDAGLGGFEFACAIPGTAGGGVRMNAGAYGSEWAAIVDRALVASPGELAWRSNAELGLAYRTSRLEPSEVVVEVEYRLTPRPTAEIRSVVDDLVVRRKASQPTNRRTFGSVFKNPPGGRGAGELIEAVGLKGHRLGGAVISPRHANFIENAEGARTSDCLALMAETRRRVFVETGIVLEQEVAFLGEIELPAID